MSKRIVAKKKAASKSGGKISLCEPVSKKKTTATGRTVAIHKKATGYQILRTLKVSKRSKQVGRIAVRASAKKVR